MEIAAIDQDKVRTAAGIRSGEQEYLQAFFAELRHDDKLSTETAVIQVNTNRLDYHYFRKNSE